MMDDYEGWWVAGCSDGNGFGDGDGFGDGWGDGYGGDGGSGYDFRSIRYATEEFRKVNSGG